MNSLRSLISILFIAFLVSCGSFTHSVSKAELESRLMADTRMQEEDGGRPWYQWSYIGSETEHHYFRRQVGRMLYSEAADGIYRIPKNDLVLHDVEFVRPNPDDSTRWKQAFTRRGVGGAPDTFSIRFGVDKPAN